MTIVTRKRTLASTLFRKHTNTNDEVTRAIRGIGRGRSGGESSTRTWSWVTKIPVMPTRSIICFSPVRRLLRTWGSRAPKGSSRSSNLQGGTPGFKSAQLTPGVCSAWSYYTCFNFDKIQTACRVPCEGGAYISQISRGSQHNPVTICVFLIALLIASDVNSAFCLNSNAPHIFCCINTSAYSQVETMKAHINVSIWALPLLFARLP